MRKRTSICIIVSLLLLSIGRFGSTAISATEKASSVQHLYVFYEAQGSSDGSSPANAAFFRDTKLWDQVRSSLEVAPVTVNFLPGEYIFSSNRKDGQFRGTFRLENIGHPEHRLVIQGLNKEGTIFRTDPDDPIDDALAFDMFIFDGTNALIRNFHFTGEQYVDYVTKLYGSHVTLADSTFIDMPHVIYGATGTHYEDSEYITVRDSVFIRIGFDSHAHMMYNAYGPQHVYVVNNYFEDSSGDYVRFRDRTDYAVVFGNTFKSTGTYRNTNRTFITVPLFNNDDPENPGPNARYETFGTHMLIANNTFIYPDDDSRGSRQTFYFLNQGYDIPQRQYLLSVDDAHTLIRGTAEEKKTLLKEQLGIDADTVFYYGNKIRGRHFTNSVAYYAFPSYGAVDRGWVDPIDITDVVVTTSVAETTEEALAFWDEFIESKRLFAAPREDSALDQPEIAVQLKTPAFTVQQVALELDGQPLYEGDQIPTNVFLRTAELTPGSHRLSVTMTDTAGDTHSDETVFFVEYYGLTHTDHTGVSHDHYRDITWVPRVKGAIALNFASFILPEEYKGVTVQVVPLIGGTRGQATTIFTSDSLPQSVSLDTLQFADGAYDIDILTTTTLGASDRRTVRFVFNNWSILEDQIEPPATHSWFGPSDRLLAVDRSAGWQFTSQTPEAFFGDVDRIKPHANSSEYLTWELTNLHHFAFTVYAHPVKPETGIHLSVSDDGHTWTDVPYAVNSQEQPGATWSKLLLEGVVPAEIDARFIRFSVSTDANADDAVELGHVLLYGHVN